MYPATAVLKSDGTLWSGTNGMGDKVIAMVSSMLARNGVKLTRAHLDALVAAGGAMRASGTATIIGNGGKDDARTETALVKLGVKVDAAIAAKDGVQLKKSAEDDAKRAEMTSEELKVETAIVAKAVVDLKKCDASR